MASTEFAKDKRRPLGRSSQCKACKAARLQRWRAGNGDRVRAGDKARYAASPKKWARHIKSTYGITKSEYDVMLAAQGGACAICKATEIERLCVDHSHASGAVRGLLCSACNQMLGQAKDNPMTLLRAALYLDAETLTQFYAALIGHLDGYPIGAAA